MTFFDARRRSVVTFSRVIDSKTKIRRLNADLVADTSDDDDFDDDVDDDVDTDACDADR